MLTPSGTPHNPHFLDALTAQGQLTDINSLHHFDACVGSIDTVLKKGQASFASDIGGSEFDLYGPDSALSTPTFITFPEPSPVGSGQGWISEGETASTHTHTHTHARRASRRISNGILDKVVKFEAMGTDNVDGLAPGQRPATPPAQNVNGK